MNKKLLPTAALLLIALLSVSARQSQTKWEYKALTYGAISEQKLNQLGAEGWELTATATSQDVTQFIFKRPK